MEVVLRLFMYLVLWCLFNLDSTKNMRLKGTHHVLFKGFIIDWMDWSCIASVLSFACPYWKASVKPHTIPLHYGLKSYTWASCPSNSSGMGQVSCIIYGLPPVVHVTAASFRTPQATLRVRMEGRKGMSWHYYNLPHSEGFQQTSRTRDKQIRFS